MQRSLSIAGAGSLAVVGMLLVADATNAQAADPSRPQPLVARRAPPPELIYDHLNPERFSANPPAPTDPYYSYPQVNTPKRGYPYGWFGARNKPRDNYYRGTRGYPIHLYRWPAR